MMFEERSSGRLEHLSKIDIQNMRASVPGQPVDQILLGIVISVGLTIDGGFGCILGRPLDPNARRQLIRVSRVQ